MLKHYSHIRMEAKRRAVNSLMVKKPEKPAADAEKAAVSNEAATKSATVGVVM
ncbi:MAG TPA: hypothetical protein VLM42_07385 [Bryobacteraceae bacterium]|nr:hypothetical protein [Bryobacteraceae bacterium]